MASEFSSLNFSSSSVEYSENPLQIEASGGSGYATSNESGFRREASLESTGLIY